MLGLIRQRRNPTISRGFTLVEITISIIVIGILATIAVFGFGAWKQKTATAEVESDLRQVVTAMQSHKNFNGGYPVLTAGTEFNSQDGQASKIFSSSSGVMLIYESGDANRFCIEATSMRVADLIYHIDSMKDGVTSQPKSGKCVTAPQLVADNFNRNQSNLGKTSTGDLEWSNLSGSWKTNGSQAVLSANSSSSSPLAVVDYQRSDADVSADIGPSDAIYFRVSDASNWWRLGQTSRTETTTYTTSEPYTYYTTEPYTYYTSEPYTYYTTSYSPGPWRYYTQFCEDGGGYPPTGTYYGGNIGGYYTYYSQHMGIGSGGCGNQFPSKKGFLIKQYVRDVYQTSVPHTGYQTVAHTGYQQVAHTGYQNVTHTTTTTYYKLVLEKSSGGAIQNVWSSSESTTQPSLARAVVNGGSISVYNSASGSPLVTITDNFNLYSSLYGIGRTVSAAAGSGIDNFSLTKPEN